MKVIDFDEEEKDEVSAHKSPKKSVKSRVLQHDLILTSNLPVKAEVAPLIPAALPHSKGNSEEDDYDTDDQYESVSSASTKASRKKPQPILKPPQPAKGPKKAVIIHKDPAPSTGRKRKARYPVIAFPEGELQSMPVLSGNVSDRETFIQAVKYVCLKEKRALHEYMTGQYPEKRFLLEVMEGLLETFPDELNRKLSTDITFSASSSSLTANPVAKSPQQLRIEALEAELCRLKGYENNIDSFLRENNLMPTPSPPEPISLNEVPLKFNDIKNLKNM